MDEKKSDINIGNVNQDTVNDNPPPYGFRPLPAFYPKPETNQDLNSVERGQNNINPNTNTATTTTTTNNNNNNNNNDTADGGRWGDFSSLNTKDVRIKFIRKVYGILTFQLIITFGIVSIFVFVEPVKTFARTSAGFGVYIASYVLFFVLIIVLSCCHCVEGIRKFPVNYILLSLVTLTMTYMLGMISAYHSTQAVLIAISVTFVVVLGVTLFSMQTKFDFTNCWMVLLCLSLALIGVAIAIGVSYRYNLILQAVYGGIGAVIMAIFLAIDTQLLMGNKGRIKFSPEDYINAALQLYLDICYLFIYILSLVSGSSGSSR